MNKKIVFGLITIVVVILLTVTGIVIYNINRNNAVDIIENVDNKNGLTGLIENEQYYYDKLQEYNKAYEEYDKLNFLSNKEELSEEQLNCLKELKNQIDILEPIVNEYNNLLANAIEKLRNENLETLEDGTIKSNRSGITDDKEYNGVKYKNIQLIYNPTDKKTVISMNVENITDEVKGNEIVYLQFKGRTEAKHPVSIMELQPNETCPIKMSIEADLTDTDTLEIVKYENN